MENQDIDQFREDQKDYFRLLEKLTDKNRKKDYLNNIEKHLKEVIDGLSKAFNPEFAEAHHTFLKGFFSYDNYFFGKNKEAEVMHHWDLFTK